MSLKNGVLLLHSPGGAAYSAGVQLKLLDCLTSNKDVCRLKSSILCSAKGWFSDMLCLCLPHKQQAFTATDQSGTGGPPDILFK